MKKIYILFAATILSIIFFECQKQFKSTETIVRPVQQTDPLTATLQGNIISDIGTPVEGAIVTVGTQTAVTDSRGYFRVTDAALDKKASLVTVDMQGYFKAFRSFMATTGVNEVVIRLIKKDLSGTVDASAGGSISLSNGSIVSLPGGGIVNSTGNAYTGNVKVYASYIDPASFDIGTNVPGSFMADNSAGKRVVLSSFGMLAVNLESPAGEKLQIADGKTATLTIPIPAATASSAPAAISLWYLDEQTGIWKEQGTAQKSGNNYIGDVKHFSYWNADIQMSSITFSAKFVTSDGSPLANLGVIVRPADNSYQGYAHGRTDSLGQVSGLIPSGINLVLAVFGGCDSTAWSENIGPFNSDADLGTITIPDITSSLVTVTGSLADCNNAPVSEGYAMIFFNNMLYNASVSADGTFSASFMSCSSLPQTIDVIGVDEKAGQQSSVMTVPINGRQVNTGVINTCGMSSLQYLNYTLDGTSYSLSDKDSLVAFITTGTGSSVTTHVEGGVISNPISFSFTGAASAGTYPLNSLSVLNHNDVKLTSPFNATISTYPQNRGEFYDGSFSGNFQDSTDLSVTHSISCTFHVRQY